ncbi:MAG: ABC transporter ATP-binding protein [Verrucomicrobia bacterium]|nr:ABC transporter ATP-binding protein [Verrucomicrobiota bacterium]
MPASADSPAPHSPIPTPSSTHDVETLAFLSQVLNSSNDPSRIKHAVAQTHRDEGEPLERLIKSAEIVGIRIDPYRESLADAIWKARDEQPLIVWLQETKRWLLLRRHSFFRVRITCPDHPLESEFVSRGALAKKLGLKSVSEVIDIGVVSAERPAEGLRGKTVDQESALLPSFHINSDSGHGHHEHMEPMKRFFGLLQPEMKDVWTIVIFSVITGLLYLALPLAVNALVSNLAFGGQSAPFQQALFFIALALFACLMLSAIIRGLQFYVAEVIQRRIFVRMTADMAYRLPRVKADSLDGVHAPEMVNRFLDVVTVQKSTSLLLLNGINIVLGGIIGLIVLGFYHPALLAFTLLILLAIIVIIFGLGRGAIRTSIEESISKYDVVNWLEELARYPRLFKGPGGYTLATDRADQLARAYLTARSGHFKILMRQISGLLLLEVLASSALLIVGGWLVLSQQLTLGQLVASELIVSAIVASISKLGKQFDSYGQGNEIFSNVSFEIPPGGRVALIGSQGSGSSTLLDLLLGLRHPTSGHICLDGFDLRSWYLEELRSSVMLIRTQDIVNGTVAENIRLGRPGVGLDEVHRALDSVGLLEDVMAQPLGMHTVLVTGGLPLSSRQRTRLLLARALVLKPRLLLLDDVFDGMDKASMDTLTSMLLSRDLPWTVIIATRDPLVASRCDNTVDLDSPACHTSAK